jgi:hypothetical protein
MWVALPTSQDPFLANFREAGAGFELVRGTGTVSEADGAEPVGVVEIGATAVGD